MTTNDWHLDERVWAAYAAGRLDPVAEASVDAHVTSCPECRAVARTQVSPSELAPVWESIRLEVTRPALPRSLRWLRRLGVSDEDLVLLSASDGMLLPWALTVSSALVCAIAAALAPVRQDETFLLIAPLVPALAVVAAYDATDPLRGLVTTTAYSKLRLALLRTSVTLVVALPVTTAVGLGIPGLEPLAFAWLLPSLALTATTLVLLTWMSPWASAGIAGTAWSVVVVGTAGFSHVDLLTGPAGQALCLAVGLAMAGAFVLRSTSYHLLGGEG